MAKIPQFMLKALYVNNSLQKTGDGFEFQLKNELGPARIVGALPLEVDRKRIPLADCSFLHSGEEVAFEAVTPENSVLMHKGEAVTVQVAGMTLRPGRHTLGISVVVKDLGEVRFCIGDTLR